MKKVPVVSEPNFQAFFFDSFGSILEFQLLKSYSVFMLYSQCTGTSEEVDNTQMWNLTNLIIWMNLLII